jgi:hypothetical protein
MIDRPASADIPKNRFVCEKGMNKLLSGAPNANKRLNASSGDDVVTVTGEVLVSPICLSVSQILREWLAVPCSLSKAVVSACFEAYISDFRVISLRLAAMNDKAVSNYILNLRPSEATRRCAVEMKRVGGSPLLSALLAEAR